MLFFFYMSVLFLLFWYVHHNFKFDLNSLAYKEKKRNSEAPEKINPRYLTLFYHKIQTKAMDARSRKRRKHHKIMFKSFNNDKKVTPERAYKL